MQPTGGQSTKPPNDVARRCQERMIKSKSLQTSSYVVLRFMCTPSLDADEQSWLYLIDSPKAGKCFQKENDSPNGFCAVI